MLVSESWLREWVSPRFNTAALAEKLTLAGLEVGTIEAAGPELDNRKIRVGKILGVSPHPDAEKLQVCEVDAGEKKAFSIVCGAANARAGLKTAVALVGAKLPGMDVCSREIRGVKSAGMLCSALELGLDEISEGIMELDEDARIGIGIADYLDLNDRVIEIELTPNRGDCLGIAGIAREVATLTGTKQKPAEIRKVRAANRDAFTVELRSPEACPSYTGRAIKNIDMSAPTPDWMVERLRRSGMRSINPIVDITNYVMQELGQPMHAFDMSKIDGGIRVRMARKGEKHKLLDGSTVTLDKDDLVIADHKKAIALAGIMGGDNSAISGSTVDIYFEAAFFTPDYMLGKARQFGMHTEASHRFERGVDPVLQLAAMERATQLVLQIAGGEAGPVTRTVEKSGMPARKAIRFNRDEILRTLGIRIPARKVSRILEDLGMKCRTTDYGWVVTPPSWRFDVQEQYDLVEEVGRCFGYDQVPPRMPTAVQKHGTHKENALTVDDFKDAMLSLGYHEAVTYSFVDPLLHKAILGGGNPIRLKNPIADNMSVMRQSLWPGLLDAFRNNVNRQESRVRLFEIGHVFRRARNSRKSVEHNHIAGLISGTRAARQWGENFSQVDFFDIKGDVETILGLAGTTRKIEFAAARNPALHPGQSAEIRLDGSKIGYIGKLHPVHMKLYDVDSEVFLFEIELDSLTRKKLPLFRDISRFPAVQRDLSFVVDDQVPVSEILDSAREAGGELLTKLDLFDIYKGKNIENNKKSLAFSLTFQSESSNLTASETDALTNKIIAVLEERLGAQLRE